MRTVLAVLMRIWEVIRIIPRLVPVAPRPLEPFWADGRFFNTHAAACPGEYLRSFTGPNYQMAYCKTFAAACPYYGD